MVFAMQMVENLIFGVCPVLSIGVEKKAKAHGAG